MTALYGLKSSYYNQMLILAEMEGDDVLEAAFVRTTTGRHSYKNSTF